MYYLRKIVVALVVAFVIIGTSKSAETGSARIEPLSTAQAYNLPR